MRMEASPIQRLLKHGMLIRASLCIVAVLAVPQVSNAQKKADASAEQRRTEQVRKLVTQNQSLEAEKATLSKERDDALKSVKDVETRSKTQVSAAQGQAAQLRREIAALKKSLEEKDKLVLNGSSEAQRLSAELASLRASSESELTQRNRSIDSLRQDIAKLSARQKELESQSVISLEQNTGLNTQLKSCSGHNKRLVGLVDEVSERYRTKSCADSRSLIEPLVGLRRAEFDRIAEDYRSKAGDERYVAPLR